MTVTEIESAIQKLPRTEISKLSEWFEKFESQFWDKQIAEDLESRFDYHEDLTNEKVDKKLDACK